MNIRLIAVAIAALFLSSTAYAGDLNGTPYTKATFCPVAAGVDTCTGETLVTPVEGAAPVVVVEEPVVEEPTEEPPVEEPPVEEPVTPAE